MTKKDYVIIGKALNQVNKDILDRFGGTNHPDYRAAIGSVLDRVSTVLSDNDKKFDIIKFQKSILD